MSQEAWRGLVRWYRRVRRPLPFRIDPTPYRVWVSEIMLQQTRVETMLPYYERFLARFPDPTSLAAASIEEVLSLWAGLGYYRRARALHGAAQILCRDHQGRLPDDRAKLLALPGIGAYTAGAILSIAFGRPEPVLDGNVLRVLSRVEAISGDPTTAPVRRTLWDLARRLVPRRSPGDFNQALMELGATLCSPRKPRCESCPLSRICSAHRSGNEETYPQASPRKRIVRVQTAALVIAHAGRVLLIHRTGTNRLDGFWEFPTAELSRPGSVIEEATTWAHQTLGFPIRNPRSLGTIRHAITHHDITCHALYGWRGPGGGGRHRDRFWSAPEQIDERPLTGSTRKIWRKLGAQITPPA